VSRPDEDAREAARMLPDLADRLRAEERGWRRLRAWPTPARRGATVLLLAGIALLVFLAKGRTDLDAYPAARLAIGIALLTAAAVLLAWTLLHPLHRRPLGRLRVAAALGAAFLLPLALALAPAAHAAVLAHPESFPTGAPGFWARALACLAFGTATGLPVAIFARLADRRAGASGRAWMAAALGGLAGTLALLLHCPIVSVAHRLAGHATVPLVAAALVLAAGRLLRRG